MTTPHQQLPASLGKAPSPALKLHVALQAGLAALVLGAVFLLEDALANVVISTALASSAYLVFFSPTSTMAQPRRVLGGHLVAVLVALAFSTVVYHVLGGHHSALARDSMSAGAVGVASLVMALTGTEHGPAAGTVLGLVLKPWTLTAGAAVIAGACILVIATMLLGRHILDVVPDTLAPPRRPSVRD